MQPDLQTVQSNGALSQRTGELALGQNRVLRNTYMLLAITMIPTIIGAMVGVNTNFSFLRAYPIMGPIGMFLVMMGLLFGVTKLRNSVWGIGLLLAFTFVAGWFLGPILQVALGLSNGAQLVGLAAGGTGVIFATMAGIATVTKRDFSFLGKFLIVGLVLLIVASLANLFFQIPALALTLSAVAVLLFSVFILYDVSRDRERRRDELRDGDDGDLSRHLQPVRQPAEPADGVRGQPRLTRQPAWTAGRHHRPAREKGLPRQPFFIAARGASAALEHRHRLHVRGVRKHVHDPGRPQPVALGVDQHARVARERRRDRRTRRRCGPGLSSPIDFTTSSAPSRGGSISHLSARGSGHAPR